jgi:GT2 family glycosyltransferase
MSKLLSVIIPTCHRNDLLSLCLDRLAPGQQSLGFEHYEVIVSDDGSDSTAADMTAEKYPWARWVEGPKRGPAANRNHGARQARGKWLVFTDDDCLPDAQWLEAYHDTILQRPDIKVFEGRTYAERPRLKLDEESPINETGGYLWSCNFAIKKTLFFDVGSFDELFPYAAMEDVDFRYRLKKEGYESLFIEKASLCHPWRSFSGVSKLIKSQNSIIYYLRKHPEEKKRLSISFFTKAFIKRTVLFMSGPIRFNFKDLPFFFTKQIISIRLILLLILFKIRKV